MGEGGGVAVIVGLGSFGTLSESRGIKRILGFGLGFVGRLLRDQCDLAETCHRRTRRWLRSENAFLALEFAFGLF